MFKPFALAALLALTLATPAAAQSGLAWWIPLMAAPAPTPPVFVPLAPLAPPVPLPPVVTVPRTSTLVFEGQTYLQTTQRIGAVNQTTITTPTGTTITCRTWRATGSTTCN